MRTFEDLINDTGGMGKFQVAIIVCVTSCLVFVGWSMLLMSYAGIIPDYHCVTDDLSLLGSSSGGVRYDNSSLNVCNINGTECSLYNFTGISRTVVTEWDLVCDTKWAKQIIISVQMAGVLVGALLAGQMSDVLGRKVSLYSINLYHIAANVVAAFSISWVMFAAMRFLVGIGIGGILVVVFTYPLEFLPVKWRPIMSVLPSWQLGVSAFSVGAYLLEDWVHLHFACAILCAPSLLGWFFVPESIRWLTLQGRLEEAEYIFGRIANMNGKAVPSDTSKVLQSIMESELQAREKARKYTYRDIFKTLSMTKTNMVSFFWWLNLSMCYYGITFGVSSLAGNVYLNIFLMAILEYPARLTTSFFNNRFGRKPTTFCFFLGSTIAACGCLVSYIFTDGDSRDELINGFSIAAVMLVGSAWGCVQIWTSELYPTVVRNLGYGWGNTSARVGGIAAPFLLNFDDIPLVAYVIMTSVLAVCTLLTVTMAETKGTNLTDSLDKKTKSVANGKDNKAFYVDITDIPLSKNINKL